MKCLILLVLSFTFLTAPSQASVKLDSFQIIPNILYTNDDVGVLFAVLVKGPERPQEITLIEADKTGLKVRHRWLLLDNGTGGDVQAGDGIYTRKVQFKEKKSKVMKFVVFSEGGKSGEVQQDLPAVDPIQTATLEIKNRPSMLEILAQVFRKLKEKI